MTYLDVNEATKLIRQVLKKEEYGKTLHVRHDRGTAYGWINISGSLQFGNFTDQEQAVLDKYGMNGRGSNCFVISPEDREYWVTRITGKPLVKLCEKCKQYTTVEGSNYCAACKQYFDGLIQAAKNERERGEQERLARKVQELFPEPKLPHTDRVTEMLEQGRIVEAMQEHNKQVKEQFKRAEQGEVINLSDLMAAKEQIDIKREDLKETVRDGKEYEKHVSRAEKPLKVHVSDYQLFASNGNPIRKATKVQFADGGTVRFLDKLPKSQAIEQSEKLRYIQ